MKKEALKLANIKSDLDRMADFYMSNRMDVKLGYAIPIVFLAVIIGILTKRVWIGLIISLFSVFDILRFIQDVQAYRNTKQLIKATVERGDISISVETLDHIAEETIYEPYTTGVRGEAHRRNWKTVRMFYFEGGGSWRVPDVNRHYAWSEDYYMSPAGLCNSSTEGEKFFFVCLQGYYDIAYIYPCDRFELGELKTGREDGI
jgi:hypothetical protein